MGRMQRGTEAQSRPAKGHNPKDEVQETLAFRRRTDKRRRQAKLARMARRKNRSR